MTPLRAALEKRSHGQGSSTTLVRTERRQGVIVLGLLLLLLGFLFKISILWTIGIIVLVVGVILFVLGSTGRAVGGRRHYF